MSALEASRVAEVLVTGSGGTNVRGSGYRIADALVVTAAHVVVGAERVVVRFEGGKPLEWRSDATAAWEGRRIDLAVVRLHNPPADQLDAVAFGQIGDTTAAVVECRAVGFPLFKLRCGSGVFGVTPPYRDSHQAEGSISTLSNRKSGTLEVALHSGPDGLPSCVADVLPPPDPWGGMSGAALWSAGHLIGVLAEHHVAEGSRLLSAVRVDALYEPEAADDLRQLLALGVLPERLEDLSDVTTEHVTPGVIPAERLEAQSGAFASELSARGPYLELACRERIDEPGRASPALLGHFFKQRGARILLVGGGGSGKTTALFKLAADAAAEAIRDGRAPVPVYARLALVDTTGRAGFDALMEVLADGLALDPAVLIQLWRTATRPLLFLLDGLNEVRPDRQAAVGLALQRLLAPGRHSYLVTSRPMSAATRLGAVPGVKVVDLLELDDDQVEEYLSERGAHLEHGASRRSLPDAARNPFVLWGLSESSGPDGTVTVPTTLGKAYATFIDEYVFGRREPAKSPPPTLYDYQRVKRPVLGRVAYGMTLRGATRAALERDVEDELVETLEAIEAAAARRRRVMPEKWCLEDFIAEVIENGILRDEAGALEFLHESVQHYFTAIEFERQGPEAVARAIPALTWRHVDVGARRDEPVFGPMERAAIMLAGLMEDAGPLVETLIARNPLVAARVAGQSESIGEPARRRAVGCWLELLERRHERYRWMGCICLGEVKVQDPAIGRRLTRLVQEESDDNVARAGREALAQHASEADVRELVARAFEELDQSDDPAVEALRELPAAVPVRLLFDTWRARLAPGRERVETLLANLRLEPVVAELDELAHSAPGAHELRSRVEQRRRDLEKHSLRGIRFTGESIISTLAKIGDLDHQRSRAARQLSGAETQELRRQLRESGGMASEVASMLLIERIGEEALPQLVDALLAGDHGVVDALRRCPPNAVTDALREPLAARARALVSVPASVEPVLHGPWEEIGAVLRRHTPIDFSDDLVPQWDGDGWSLFDRGRPDRGRSYRLWLHGDVLALADLTGPVSAIRGLGAAGGARALSLLVDCLADPSTTIRAAAARALGDTGSPDAVPALVGLLRQELKDPTRDVVEATLDAIGHLAFPAPLPALLEALETITHDGHQEVAWRLISTDAGTGPVCRVLDRIGARREGVEWACSALHSRDEDRRLTGVAVLRRWREEERRLAQVALDDASAAVRQGAAEALRGYRGDHALPMLLNALTTGDAGARQAAARALGAFQDEAALLPLVDRLDDINALVRVEAASSILELKSDEHSDVAANTLVREAAPSPVIAGLVVSRLRRTAPDAITRLPVSTLEHVARHGDDADARDAAYAALPAGVEERELQAMDNALAAGRAEEAAERAGSWLAASHDARFCWIYYYARGVAEMRLERFDAALADAEAAVRLTWLAPAYRLHAEALQALGRPREALEAAENAANTDPDDGALQAELATYASKAGDAPRALKAARSASELAADDPEVLLTVVPVLLQHGADDEAAAAVRHAAEAARGLDTDSAAALATTAAAALEEVAGDLAHELADDIRRLLLSDQR
jgi:HEAT repeat protein